MSPAIKQGFYTKVLKIALIVPVLVAIAVGLIMGYVFARAAFVSFIISGLLFRLWRHRHNRDTEYDEVGYWSGLDDFELGIDLDCFNDLELSDDDLDIFPGDYYDGRPI